jgi:hypothetical protein
MSTATKDISYYFNVPGCRLGRRIPEERIKCGLQDLNRDIFFDVATRHGKTYPFMDYHQAVYYAGRPEGKKYVCPMDRGGPLNGMISEVPVWATVQDMVRVPWDDVTIAELQDHSFGSIMPCFDSENHVLVKRHIKGDVILFGWRSVFLTLSRAHIPGITLGSLENKFRLSLQATPEELKILDESTPPWLDENASDQPEEGEVLEEMGVFEKRPTTGPWEGTK